MPTVAATALGIRKDIDEIDHRKSTIESHLLRRSMLVCKPATLRHKSPRVCRNGVFSKDFRLTDGCETPQSVVFNDAMIISIVDSHYTVAA
jgi:hypothetical protein